MVKTGGLGDVSYGLPNALQTMGHDVRIVMPAYASVLKKLSDYRVITTLALLDHKVSILESYLADSKLPIMLLDCPALFEQSANPYVDEHGRPWSDNATRFGVFSKAITLIAGNRANLDWQPDIVHCNDWQTALVPALLYFEPTRPALIFTIHNLAYQGIFPFEYFSKLELPAELWSYEGLEFYGDLSFIKGGIVYADRVTTVSPTYAKEIQTVEFGCGLHGLLEYVNKKLNGITNGIDTEKWNPANDSLIAENYVSKSIINKVKNKIALQDLLTLPIDNNIPVFGVVSRLTKQKGIDLIINLLSYLRYFSVQVVILGSGDQNYEDSLKAIANRYPKKFKTHIDFDERLAHQITAAADIFLMPSEFEPCGLNQQYSQRYGTIPIVHAIGGLADTVVNVDQNLSNINEATGFSFTVHNADELLKTVMRALDLYHDQTSWRKLQENGMRKDFSWAKSAKQYLQLYKLAMADYFGEN